MFKQQSLEVSRKQNRAVTEVGFGGREFHERGYSERVKISMSVVGWYPRKRE